MKNENSTQKPFQPQTKLNSSSINEDTHIEADVHEDQPLLNDSEPKSPKLRDSNIRWLVLFLIIMTSFGGYYCYETPQPLQAPIEEIFQIQDAKFNMVYSMANLPNVIAPLVGGILTDSYGIRAIMIFFLFVVFLGQAVITIGAKTLSFEMMIAGRFIYGVGCQIVENGLIVMVTKWFIAKDFTLAWGLARAVLRGCSALNSFLTPKIYYWTNELYAPFLFGLIILGFSLICMFIAAYFDKKAEKELKVVVSANFRERIMLKDLHLLTKMFFLMMIFVVLIYGSFHSLTNNLNNILVQRFGFNPVSAGSAITIMFLIPAVASPFIGIMIDRIGKRANFLIIGTIFIFFAQFILIFLEDREQGNPNYWVILSLVYAGGFYAFYSTTFWTSLSLVVKFQAVGTANGLITCITSIYDSLLTEGVGFIHDNSLEVHKGYYYTQILQCGFLTIGVIFSLWVYFEDRRTGRRLQSEKVEIKEKNY